MKKEDSNVVSHLVGDFGKWQATISLLLSLLKLPIGWFQLSIVFLAPVTNFWCAVPKEGNSWFADMSPTERINYTMNNCDVECSEYAFNTTVFKSTIISEVSKFSPPPLPLPPPPPEKFSRRVITVTYFVFPVVIDMRQRTIIKCCSNDFYVGCFNWKCYFWYNIR